MIPKEHTYTKENGNTYLTADYVNYLKLHDLIVDGSKGGLLKGPTKQEGGITLIGMNKEAEVYVGNQLEAWYFLINAYAFRQQEEALTKLSSYLLFLDSLFYGYVIPKNITVIDASPRLIDGKPVTPFVWFDTDVMGFMPRVPAKGKLDFLEKINQDAWTVRREWEKPEPTVNNEAHEAKYGEAATYLAWLGGKGSN